MGFIMNANSKIILGALAGAAVLLSIRRNSVSGIGATKRRIYKEISLAQKAGVDFTKKYEELTEDEIEALERVSSNTGFTETYYKGLKKAYDAISGIGEAYDVTDEDGNTVLTWIEDPEASEPVDESERWQALLDAREIEDEIRYANENRTRDLEEREKRLAAQRRKLAKSGRTTQMALFGVKGIPLYSKQQLDSYLETHQDLSFIFTRGEDGKIYVEAGDERGGRDFFIGKNNFKYLYSYILRNFLPFAIWNGDHWIVRNDKNDTLGFGVGYTPEIEAELYEIWREQIEYNETDYDYDTWRRLVGDDYAKQYVLPYM